MEDYKLINVDSTEKLENEVKALMAEDWQPTGGVAVMFFPAVPMVAVVKHFFIQAMVK